MDKLRETAAKIEKAAESLPGVAENIADKAKATLNLVKERTRTLNNNPRNNNLDE